GRLFFDRTQPRRIRDPPRPRRGRRQGTNASTSQTMDHDRHAIHLDADEPTCDRAPRPYGEGCLYSHGQQHIYVLYFFSLILPVWKTDEEMDHAITKRN